MGCNSSSRPSSTAKTDAASGEAAGLSRIPAVLEAQLQEERPEVAAYDLSRAKAWDPVRFKVVKQIQEAERNEGFVDLASDATLGGFVAVKRMPLTWTADGPAAFAQAQPGSEERPWNDIAIADCLHRHGCEFACKFHGIFRDEGHAYVVTSFASAGDLFSWNAALDATPGSEREARIAPVAKQLLAALQQLHDLGIAHRDVSLENVLLDQQGGELRVKLIDYGMATAARKCAGEIRGKEPYQAPEMHREETDGAYDPFLADSFAVGVVIFALALKEFPWMWTKPGNCASFDLVVRDGFRTWLESRGIAHVLSELLLDALEGLLEFDPQARATLGERCWQQCGATTAQSIWDIGWLDYLDFGDPQDTIDEHCRLLTPGPQLPQA